VQSNSSHEENAIFFGDIKVKNLVAMPENAREFMTAQRWMAPVRREEREFRASGALNLGGLKAALRLYQPNDFLQAQVWSRDDG
jgi:hypothetical protein